jgi:hypothetical protein
MKSRKISLKPNINIEKNRKTRKNNQESKRQNAREIKRTEKREKKTMELMVSEPSKKRKIFDIKELIGLKAGEAFEWVYGFQSNAIVEFEGITKEFKNARDWWEHSNPTTQCNNTVKKWEPNTLCYICGLSMATDNLKKYPPECEHILPVYQGSLFLTLYSSNIDADKKRKELNMEYKWAHRCCNQVKKSISFMTFEKNKFKFDYSTCSKILNSIYEGKTVEGSRADYCSDKISIELQKLINQKKKQKKDWIMTRTQSIQYNEIDPIASYLNTTFDQEKNKGLFYLGILSNLISAADGNYITSAQNELGKMTPQIKRLPIHVSNEKMIAITSVSSEIASNLSKFSFGRDRDIMKKILSQLFYFDSSDEKDVSNLIQNNLINFFIIQKILLSNLISSHLVIQIEPTDKLYLFNFKNFYINIFILLESIIDRKDIYDNANNCFKIMTYISLIYKIKDVSISTTDEREQTQISVIKNGFIGIMNTNLQKYLEQIMNNAMGGNGNVFLLFYGMLSKMAPFYKETLDEILLSKSILPVEQNNKIATLLNDKNVIEKRYEYYNKYNTESSTISDFTDEIDLLETNAINSMKNLQNEQVFKLWENQQKEEKMEIEIQKEILTTSLQQAEKKEDELKKSNMEIEETMKEIEKTLLEMEKNKKRNRSEETKLSKEIDAAETLLNMQNQSNKVEPIRKKMKLLTNRMTRSMSMPVMRIMTRSRQQGGKNRKNKGNRKTRKYRMN